MGRILAIDLGMKRTGLAQTDPLQIIASPFQTLATDELFDFLKTYVPKERVEILVLGYPTQEDGSETHMTQPVLKFKEDLAKIFPKLEVILQDERYTSKMAMEAMIKGGTSKKYRRNKANIDKTSATIMLQEYLDSKPQ